MSDFDDGTCVSAQVNNNMNMIYAACFPPLAGGADQSPALAAEHILLQYCSDTSHCTA